MLARQPIAAQVMALVALAILITAGAMAVITFSGPPPRERPHEVDEIVRALDGAAQRRSRIERTVAGSLDDLPPDLVPNATLARIISARAGLPASAIRAFAEPDALRGPRPFLDDFVVARRQGDGRWLILSDGPDHNLRRWQWLTVSTILAVALAVGLIAWFAARRIAMPIERLAMAARSSRAGAPWQFTAPDGPPEIAAAAQALADMHQRNHAYAEQRLTMLAAIAHDIGTPLARIAFRSEGMDDSPREASMRDIETIRRLLSDSLTLARGWAGKVERLDLASLCRNLAERGAQTGVPVACDAPGAAWVDGNALSLERMVQNLVDNAVRYGRQARLGVERDGAEAVLRVVDCGPGFPDIAPDELLRPFVRGEASRNSATGGSGLGLAIVAQVVEQHCGSVQLGTAEGGGAQVTVRLPLARDLSEG